MGDGGRLDTPADGRAGDSRGPTGDGGRRRETARDGERRSETVRDERRWRDGGKMVEI